MEYVLNTVFIIVIISYIYLVLVYYKIFLIKYFLQNSLETCYVFINITFKNKGDFRLISLNELP